MLFLLHGALRPPQFAVDVGEPNLVSIGEGRLGDRLTIDVGFVGASEVDERQTIFARSRELRVKLAQELIRNDDAVGRVFCPMVTFLSHDGMVHFTCHRASFTIQPRN